MNRILEDTIHIAGRGVECVVCGKDVSGGRGFAHINHEGEMIALCGPLCVELFLQKPANHVVRRYSAALVHGNQNGHQEGDRPLSRMMEDMFHIPGRGDECIVCGKDVSNGHAFAHVNHQGEMIALCGPLCVELFQQKPVYYVFRRDSDALVYGNQNVSQD